MADISTNISYLGVRGFQRLPMHDFNFVYQFEAGVDISVTPGLKQDNSKLSNQVNGGLFFRNTYIGLASSQWGAIKIGKTDAPYKNSTAAFNPFSVPGAITKLSWATGRRQSRRIRHPYPPCDLVRIADYQWLPV